MKAGPRIDRPIFIVAPPRCGTSILYRCIASHPDVGFFNRANKRWPDSPRLAYWVTRVGSPLGFYRDTPRESRALWFRFLRGRGNPLADERDARPEVRAWYAERISAVLALRGASRFASKLPAHSVQLGFLDALFPDAIFVQPIRDWRAVVASTVRKRERDLAGQWFGVRLQGWQEAARQPPHLGAAWHYCAVHQHLEQQALRFPGRHVRLHYEDLTAAPQATMRRVFEQCGLRCDASILERLPREIRPAHERWRETLTPQQLAEIAEVHGDALHRYEFPLEAAATARA